ncbi:ABC transporter ATP-binding protein [Arthrobacter sp. AK01]|uniref:ABC transporter ATP-binding protein n=1 Tax=Arthrobacter sp. AK01 TaxID=2894084 RepID=UPI001E4051CE|nr:ABC transporter ATP-binding protein [Arthrobacter sp. AK01]MCD4853443.1 ABC transporter ATP-binding protein [Arthrobacter sp. AK01]
MNFINVENLSKNFGQFQALNDVSFSVKAGGSLAIIGPNGSGKTTLVRCLLGLLNASEGTANIAGQPYDAGHPCTVGYLPEERGNFQRDTPLDVLRLFGKLRGLTHHDASSQAYEYLDDVGLAPHARSPIQTLSNGQQQKIHLGITFVGNPDLLVLDEPTRGFDPVNQAIFKTYLERHLLRGATLILVTNQMHEVEELTNNVLFLRKGKQHFAGEVEEAKQKLGGRRTALSYTGVLPPHASEWNVEMPENGTLLLDSRHEIDSANQLLGRLLNSGVKVTDFSTRLSSLDEIFVGVYGDSAQLGSLN